MKELFKVISKKYYIISVISNMIYSLADYGEAFALSIFATSPLNLDKIVSLTICMVVLYGIMLVFGKIINYVETVNNVRSQETIQKYYFKKMQSLTIEQITNNHTGYVHKLITSISELFVDLVWQIEITVLPLIIGGISIFYMLCTESFITGIICIVISFLAVFLKFKMIKSRQKYRKKVNEESSKYNAIFIDFIQNIMTVKKLRISKFCEDKIDNQSNEYLKVTKLNEQKRVNANGVFTLLMDILFVMVLLSTIAIVKDGGDGLPYLLFYLTALSKLYSNLNGTVKLLDKIEKFKSTKKQLDDYFMNIKQMEIIDKFEKVELSNVKFSYTDSSTCIEIPKFELKIGDKISIVGESGQGKTTVMNILSGLYPLKNGNLKINNEIRKDALLDIVFVSQEVELFNLSVRDNLCLGKEISDEKIIELFNEAGLIEWYKSLPKGLDTIVGEKGIKLSAGQKQRLNLIRGILIDKELYFFDEPTSNLDTLSEEKIIEMINKYLNKKTYIIVTHREKIEKLCTKHYLFENHTMKEIS